MTIPTSPSTLLLGRAWCPLSQCWRAPGLVDLSAELVEPLLQPGATVADLVGVLAARDRIHARGEGDGLGAPQSAGM